MVMTITEFARLGGKARAAKLSKERRIQISSMGGKAKSKKKLSTPKVLASKTDEE